MRLCRIAVPLLAGVMVLCARAGGQPADAKAGETPAASPTVGKPMAGKTLKDVAFIAGSWRGEDHGEMYEEIWSSASGKNMTGLYRWLQGDKAVMFEILTISQEKERVVLRLRHFHGNLQPWKNEDQPAELNLIELNDVGEGTGEAVFESVDAGRQPRRIAYDCRKPGKMDMRVEFTPESKRETLVFSLKRTDGGSSGAAAKPAGLAGDKAKTFYERFKKLEGSWECKSTKGWTDRQTYRTIAGGSCVMHQSFEAHPGEQMATMVHLDGERLMLTHYCSAKNQPRLLATEASDDGKSVTFTFLDGTNMASRDKGHMDKVVYTFSGDDAFTSRWTWCQDGKEKWLEEIEHRRVKGNAAPADAKPTEGRSHH